ncbi:MAG TPA: class I SAM-dependent methyltransferase [Candidatus Solibacter sp.]|jgi:SAM-dependent methyltransferase|nr:class I SAM-dependent methyltransferase [Candidatus Solibacter sp.]
MSSSIVNDNPEIYYSGVYWNDFKPVVEYMSRCFTGDPATWWEDDFRRRFCATPFESALFLNCGNGWVERQFIDRGMVTTATAFDYSADLVAVAEAEKGTRPITYFQADANTVELGKDRFDLVVNVAALHHVQKLDRLHRQLCAATRPDGIFVNFEYIGPARNQYGKAQWRHIEEENAALPERVRKEPLVMPHLPTMLVTDPTEAIHSDLILKVQARYFDIFERHDTGGGVAYQLLTHNPKLQGIPEAELRELVGPLLDTDWKLTQEGRVPPLFSYFLSRPRKPALRNPALGLLYSLQENGREALARRRRGVYSWGQFRELKAHEAANRG